LVDTSEQHRNHEEGNEPLESPNDRPKGRDIVPGQRWYGHSVVPEGSADPEADNPQVERPNGDI
jgi:hypothetical protein